jgi:hypothetical protein
MADFQVIDFERAPRPTRQSGRLTGRMREYEKYIGSVRKGYVGILEPGPGETIRGESLRINRAAKRLGRTLQTWSVDGFVYFKPE